MGKAPVLGGTNSDGPGGAGQLASSERQVAAWRGREEMTASIVEGGSGSRLSVCARSAALEEPAADL